MMEIEALLPQTPAIVGHYERAVDYLIATFEGIPLSVSFFPKGLDQPGQFVSARHQPLPPSIRTVAVRQPSGEQTYVALEPNGLLWLVHRGAVCIFSWSPSRFDPEMAGFARILVRPLDPKDLELEVRGLLGVRAALAAEGLDAVPMRAGASTALWVPLFDGPPYEAVASWLNALVARLASAQPDLYTLARSHEVASRVHLSVTSNHVGRFSSLPYGLLGEPRLSMVTPFAWNSLATALKTTVTAHDSAAFFAKHGDVFADEVARIGPQPFGRRTAGAIEPAALELLRRAEADWERDIV